MLTFFKMFSECDLVFHCSRVISYILNKVYSETINTLRPYNFTAILITLWLLFSYHLSFQLAITF